ncbi:2-oxo acid dehydrogenase subunit E2 [Nocardia sp. NPDC056100]|uniref:2-oxo acid dehydrogenase subunit E2 n=1 Tax=Nocardia sp. NPDC056100 TaxID=3345712 RepID=UPI0035DF2999
MAEIFVPVLNANDESCTLVEWLCEDGDRVRAGDPIAVAETSKASVDIVADVDGILQRAVAAATEITFGEPIGHLFDSEEQRLDHLAAASETVGAAAEPTTKASYVLTDAARALVEQHGITDEQLRGLGKRVIRGGDVENLTSTTIELSLNQRQVARSVSRSWQSIPAAYNVTRLLVANALALRQELRAERGIDIGLPVLLIRAIARLHNDFPLLFASIGHDGRTATITGADIGVTVDAGAGLFVPVLRDPAGRPIEELAADLARLQKCAVQGRFSSADLVGGALTVSINPYHDTVFVIPLVFPGQSVAVSLAAVTDEIVLDPANQPVRRPVTQLGIAYDHRLVNGRDAAMFSRRLKGELESPLALRNLLT